VPLRRLLPVVHEEGHEPLPALAAQCGRTDLTAEGDPTSGTGPIPRERPPAPRAAKPLHREEVPDGRTRNDGDHRGFVRHRTVTVPCSRHARSRSRSVCCSTCDGAALNHGCSRLASASSAACATQFVHAPRLRYSLRWSRAAFPTARQISLNPWHCLTCSAASSRRHLRPDSTGTPPPNSYDHASAGHRQERAASRGSTPTAG
jgi:hypothetical protein